MKQPNIIEETPFVDMLRSYNNGVLAVYIIGKDILDAESRQDMLGIPFLVWNGSWTPIGPSVERARQIVGVPYISLDQFKKIEDAMITTGGVPKGVETNGIEYPLDRLASDYVPYSFGAGHQYDKEENRRIRSLSEYDNLVNNVLPEVAKVRMRRTEQKAKDNNLVNRVLASVNLYKPASFSRYQPLATL